MNYEFQDHKDIIMSGLSKPDNLVNSIQIKVEASANIESPLNAMIECIDVLINKFSHIGSLVVNLKEQSKSSNTNTKAKVAKK